MFFKFTEFFDKELNRDHSAYSRAALINFFVPNAVLIRGRRLNSRKYGSETGIDNSSHRQ